MSNKKKQSVLSANNRTPHAAPIIGEVAPQLQTAEEQERDFVMLVNSAVRPIREHDRNGAAGKAHDVKSEGQCPRANSGQGQASARARMITMEGKASASDALAAAVKMAQVTALRRSHRMND